VATTLSIQPQAGVTVVEAIADWLRGRRLLLVLDNCEHVLAAAGELASAIVTHCPTVTVLATSREPLGVAGERVVPLTGLGTADAVDLFCERVVAVDDTVTLSADDQRAVVSICEELDGIPLAIELAAARVRSLTPTEVRDRLGDRLRLLRSSRRRGSERHGALRATVDWSYQLLTGDERLLFDRLSVFAGGFDLGAVEAICAAPPLDGADVFELLASLVDKSMVVADRGADGTRYRLLETLRQFAAERLAATGNANELRERHLGYYLAIAQKANQLLVSPHQLTGDGIFDRDWDNLRASHGWAINNANVDAADLVVAATACHAGVRGRHEHGDWAKRTLELESAGLHPASATYARAAFAALQAGENEACVAFAERGLRRAPGPDHADAAGCWWVLILAHLHSGRAGAAANAAQHLAMIEPALSDPFAGWQAVTGLIENAMANDRGSVPKLVDRLAERAGHVGAPSLSAQTSFYRALSALFAEDPRDPERAFAAAQDGLELARSFGDPSTECANLLPLAMAAVVLRRPDGRAICRDAIARCYDVRMWHVVWLLIETAAGFFAAGGNFQEAAVLYGHLETHRPPFGMPGARRARQRGLDRLRQFAEADVLMAQGAAMDRDELIAYTVDSLCQPAQQQFERT
jgi:predicted ATPase